MLSFDPQKLTEKENYKLLTGSILPRPIAFITTLSEKNILNGAPFSYFNIVSSNPPLISVSVQRNGKDKKDTSRNIAQQKKFVVHITDEENVEQINLTSSHLSPDDSEIELANLTTVKSERISVPGIKEAKIRFECELERYIEIGNSSDEPVCELIIGRIVYYHISHDLLDEKGRIKLEELRPVSRLAGNQYSKIGELFSLKRPK